MARLATGVYKRSDGFYQKNFSINGRRYWVYASSIKELNAKELEKRKAIESGEYKPNNRITLDEYFQSWIKERAKSVKGSTVRTYELEYNRRISPDLGRYRIQKIEPQKG